MTTQRLDRANNPPTKAESPRITTLQLFFGYCESERMAGLVIARVGTKGFKTAHGALRSFLRDCRTIIQDNGKCAPRACCIKAQGEECTFCPKCGTRLGETENEVDEEDLAEFVQELDADIDGVGSETMEALEIRGWKIGDSRAGDWLVVHGMDYLIKGEYSSCWSVLRMTVGKARHITNRKSEDFSL